MADIKIFLTNLGKYNEGELVGEWVDLPVDEDELKEVYKRIGISDEPDADGNYYEETFITDYESDIPGLEIGEYDSISELNEMAEEIENLDDWDIEKFKNALEAGFVDDIKDFDPDRFILYHDVYTKQDLGIAIIEDQYGGLENMDSDTISNYFDYESYGRDCRYDWDARTWLDPMDEEEEAEICERYGVDDLDDITIYDYCGTYEGDDVKVGMYMIDELGGPEVLGRDTLENYFDYADFASDIANYSGDFTEDGFIEDLDR